MRWMKWKLIKNLIGRRLTGLRWKAQQVNILHYVLKTWTSGRDGRIRTQNLEIPSKKIARTGDLHPEKFSVFRKFLLLWNESPRFRKNCRFSGNVGKFLSVHGNFLLLIWGDSFSDFTWSAVRIGNSNSRNTGFRRNNSAFK